MEITLNKTSRLLRFDEAEHKYRYAGSVVPSCTTVLKEWLRTKIFDNECFVNTHDGTTIPAGRFDKAAAAGTAIHAACADYFDSGCDASPPAGYEGVFEQFRRWVDDFCVSPYIYERPLYSPQYGYAGTFDFWGDIAGLEPGQSAVVDFKTGGSEMVGPQTAGYAQLIAENVETDGAPVDPSSIKRFCLILPKNGSRYTFKSLENSQDWWFFQAKLFVHKYHANGAAGLHYNGDIEYC